MISFLTHSIKLSRLFIAFSFLIVCSNYLRATPEFALWSDNRCSKCHVASSGGGIRNDFGGSFGRESAIFSYSDIGLTSDNKQLTNNSFFDNKLFIGGDLRFQFIRSHKVENPVTRLIPMQATISAAVNFPRWLILEGQYNFGRLVFLGQRSWAASLMFKPSDDLPSLRIGFFQPSLGIRDCDMTSLDRRIAATDGTESLIPPDYAEWGAEIDYEAFDWITLNTGIFDSEGLSQLQLFGGQLPLLPLKHNPSFIARIVLYPSWLIEFLPEMYIGASSLINGDFIYNNYFTGFALQEDIHLYFKYAQTNLPYTRTTNNMIFGAMYMPFRGLFLGARCEYGDTELIFYNGKVPLKTWQLVYNSKAFILPSLEFIPELRYVDCPEYRSWRWVFQFHIYN
jgi:hypothetical protein